jgi:hypothetical protein
LGVAQNILSASEDVTRGDEAFVEGQVSNWMQQYLIAKPPGSPQECLASYCPFVDSKGVYIMLSHFQPWLRQNVGVLLELDALGMRLRLYGAEDMKYRTQKMSGERTTQNVWRLPIDPGPYLDGLGIALPEISSMA